ncbi:unnamed protein product, partial [Brenthis ino]
MLIIKFLLAATLVKLVKSKYPMEAKIVNGIKVPIMKFAHSAFMVVYLPTESYLCGASIVTQNILLTAAHCIESCGMKCARADVFVGNADKRFGYKFPILHTIRHEKYSPDEVRNDIGLILLKNELPLSKYIMRVALMREPPIEQTAFLAGWGLIDEIQHISTNYLHFTKQKIWSYKKCRRKILSLPKGTLCGGDIRGKNYGAEGDSGSALVIKDYIQIGIVSYKRPDVSNSLLVYTNVAYFYDWIENNSRKIFCGSLLN